MVLLAIAACESGQAPPSSDVPLAFTTLCAPCHGPDARGYVADRAPSLVNPTFLESASDSFLQTSIALGRPGTSMAGYGKEVGGPLAPPQIAELVKWLRSRGPALVTLRAAGRGDVARGAAIYARACVTCHGTRDTRGSAVHLANPRFLQLASDAFVRWAIVNGRPGTAMEAWHGKLDDGQVDDLVAYVRSLSRPPPVALLPPPTGKEPLVLAPGGKAPSFALRDEVCPPRGASPATNPCVPGPRYVSIDQVERALAAGDRMIVIDARPASDWQRVHITGAVSIPYFDMARLAEVPRDGTWVIAYCACPHHLSGIVIDELRKRGYAHTAVLDEGILEWHRRGYPVVAAPGVGPPPAQAPPPATPH